MSDSSGVGGGGSKRGGGLVVHPLDVHEIDCTPCEQGCCGRRRIAVPEDLYQRLLMVKRAMEEVNGRRIATCRVFNLFADVICTALGRVPRRPISIKAVEEMISRELVYKSQYTLGRLAHAPDPRTAWSFLELGLRAWFLGIHRMLNAQPRIEATEYIGKLLEWWGVRNRFDFAWLLRNALNDDRLMKVEHAQGTRYTQDIVAFTLTQAGEEACRNWPRGRAIDATNHLPVILTIIRGYLRCLGINNYLDYLRWLNDRKPPTRGNNEDDN